jgi:hypothetical protein
MKSCIVIAFLALVLAGCAREDTSVGGSPNVDTGMAQQNTVAKAESKVPGTAVTHTNAPAKPPYHPPER